LVRSENILISQIGGVGRHKKKLKNGEREIRGNSVAEAEVVGGGGGKG